MLEIESLHGIDHSYVTGLVSVSTFEKSGKYIESFTLRGSWVIVEYEARLVIRYQVWNQKNNSGMVMEIFGVILFAIGATFTPGPNNILIMGSAINFGISRSIPLWLGMCLGFPLLLITIGFGLNTLLEFVPDFHLYLKIMGSTYLLYFAYKLFGTSQQISDDNEIENPLGFFHGVAFQWINPKSWIVAVSAISSFSLFENNQILNAVSISITFVAISLPCVGIWMVSGNYIRIILNTNTRVLWFNRVMALLLVTSIAQAWVY